MMTEHPEMHETHRESTAATGEPLLTIRRARAEDVGAIVALLADDTLGATREDPADHAPYRAAFQQIDADPSELLLVADSGGQVVGTVQLSLLPGLARQGALRAQIEAVRIAGTKRGSGLGEAMITFAIEEARRRGATIVQLTSDKSRTAAHRFYERLGFAATHEGYKLTLQ